MIVLVFLRFRRDVRHVRPCAPPYKVQEAPPLKIAHPDEVTCGAGREDAHHAWTLDAPTAPEGPDYFIKDYHTKEPGGHAEGVSYKCKRPGWGRCRRKNARCQGGRVGDDPENDPGQI